MELQLPRGMRDFAPEEKLLRDEVVAQLKATFERYGFNPLETPIVERWEILSAKYGGGEEILKETFKFRDQGERDLGLRYDLTTPLARFVGMNPSIKKPFKRYHIGPVYRDGPIKKGRYREFTQCDVDTVGTHSMLADAECVLLALDFFEQIGFDVEIRVNNRKLLNRLLRNLQTEISQTKDAVIVKGQASLDQEEERFLRFILTLDKLEKIGSEAVLKELEEKGLKREHGEKFLEVVSTSGTTQEKIEVLEQRLTQNDPGVRQIQELFLYLGNENRVRFTPSLARGLGYYTGTIFEVYMADGSFDGAVGAGGRYDAMIGDFLGSNEQIPAVGISFGLEPIVELMKDRQELQRQSVVQVYVIPIQTTEACLSYVQQLRKVGIPADIDLVGRGPSANLKYANAYGVPYALIVGPDELESGVVTLRDMKSGDEQKLPFEAAVAQLQA